MTRTAKSPRLSQHMGEPYLEVHADDAARLGLMPAGLADVRSPQGSAILRVLISDKIRPGEVFAPMHWSAQNAAAGRVDALVAANTDPVSGQPDSKGTAVSIAPFAPAWYGFAVSAQDMTPDSRYWAMARSKHGWRAELAGHDLPLDWDAYARDLFNMPDAETMSVTDPARGIARVALMREGRLVASLFAGPQPVAVSRGHVATLLGEAPDLYALSGRPGGDRPDPGATVCACFDVGVNTILAGIASQGLTSVEAIGEALQAGTNCGSCRPELAAILAGAVQQRAAE